MPEKANRRRWVKYLLRGLLLVMLSAALYQPILFGLAQLVAGKLARSQALSLQFKIHGSIISSLYLEDFHLQTLPENTKLPVERVDAKWVALRYNLLRLLQKDYLDAVELVELKNVDVVVRPTSEPPQKNPNGLRIPQILPKKIDVQDLNLTIRSPAGDVKANNLALQFQQGSEGQLRCETLRLPAIGVWHQLQARLSYGRNKLELKGLALDPILDLQQLQIDLSGSEDGQYRMTLDGKALGSSFAANASYSQPAERPSFALAMNVIGLQLGEIRKQWSLPISGSIPKIEIQLSGEPDRPQSFAGSISAAGSGLTYQDYDIGNLAISLIVHQGKGEIHEFSVNSGPNKVRVTGNFSLPETWDELPTGSSANLGIAAAVSEPARYAPGLNAGSMSAGSIRLANGRAQAVFSESVTGISLPKAVPGMFISSVSSTVFAVLKIPVSKDIWPSLAVAGFTDSSNIMYQDLQVQKAGFSAETTDGKTAAANANVESGESRIQVSARLPLPISDESFDPKQVTGGITFHLASISDFSRQKLVEGTLTAKGDLRFDHLRVDGTVRADGRQLKYRGMILQSLSLDAVSKDGEAHIQNFRLEFNPSNYLQLTGSAKTTDPFPFQASGGVTFKDLAVLNDFIKNLGAEPGLSGGLTVNVAAAGDVHSFTGKLQLSGQELQYRGVVAQDLDIRARAAKTKVEIETCRLTLDPANRVDLQGTAQLAEPYPYTVTGTVALTNLGVLNGLLKNVGQPADLAGSLSVDLSGNGDVHNPTAQLRISGDRIRYRGLPLQNVDIEAHLENLTATVVRGRLNLDTLNYADFTGDIGLSTPNPYRAKGVVELNDLAVFKDLLKGAGESSAAAGNVHANWSASGDARSVIPDANLRVLGNEIKYRGLTIQALSIDGNLLQKKLDLPTCKIAFNKDNFIDAQGSAVLDEPYSYDGHATVQLQDLGFVNELIKSFGQDLGLAGKLNASWKGKGPLKDQMGNFELHGEQIQTKAVQNVKFDATAQYQGFKVEVPQFQLTSPYADVNGAIRFSPQSFEIPELKIRRDGSAISGNVKVALDLQSGRKVPLDLDQPLDINFQGDKIALDSFQPGKAQVTGTVGLRFKASQTLRNPLIEFTASARDVRATSVSSLSAANGDFSIRVADKVVTASGKVQQPDVHPLTLTGQMPLDVGQIIQAGTVPDNTPLQFALKWPDNNLAFIRKIIPNIKVVEGRAGADVTVRGTLKQPDLAGSINANLSRFQTSTDAVPPISDFVTNLAFQRDHIQITQLKGLAGGGRFGMEGGIDLKDGTNPKFNLGVTGNQVLLTRSDGIIVRANLNLAIRGPLSNGEVSGTVGITDSRFFKDIDILPLNLPGRPPPQSATPTMPKIAVDTPPFKDWKFNIAVRTDDPFLVQSNLARGKVVINLQAGGTGAAPSLTGFVRIDRLVASLPFSKMEIDNGSINFVQGGNLLDPSLSITGHSTVSDYEVRARIFGNVSNPTVFLDSSPPLAQGDILVLLATGSPTSAYEQDPSLLAGRASFLVLEQTFKKIFPNTNRANQQKRPFIDRFSVNIAPGNRAGEQDIVSRFKLTKNWEIIGDFGTSSYQGRLKYLVRFR